LKGVSVGQFFVVQNYPDYSMHHKIFRIRSPHLLNAANSPHGHCDNLIWPSDFHGSSTEPLRTTGLLEEDMVIEYTKGLRVRG